MAATLDADQELLHFSFPIEKQEDTDSINPVDGTPDIWITGKATDGTVDADRQIVDPEWSAVALKEWAATGGNVRMAHDPKRPVGKGHDVQVTMDGHYVRSCISDPLAKHFIRTGVLNDYSVGISMPHIKFGPHKGLDPRGEATGGIITGRPDGLSKIAELSVVDRGSNFHSKFQITRKSAGGGDDFGFIGKMVGDSAEIVRAAPPDLLAKVPGGDLVTKGVPAGAADDDFVNVDLPKGASISISPADFAKLRTLKQQLVTKAAGADAVKRDFDRNVGGGTDRDKIPAEDFAGKNRSFPIVNQSDVSDALQSIGSAGDDNYDAGTLRSNIISIARRKGFSVPGDDGDSKSKGTVAPTETETDLNKAGGLTDEQAAAVHTALQNLMLALPAAEKADAPEVQDTATADVTKEPADAGNKPVKKAKKKPKKLPPWLNKPKDDDGDGDSKDSDDDSGACKSFMDHTWVQYTDGTNTTDVQCKKCHTTPAAAANVAGAPMDPAPVGELMESTAPVSAKGATPQSASGAQDAAAMKPVPSHREPDGAEVEAFEKDSGMSDGDSEAPTRLEAPMLKASPEVSAMLRFKSIGIDPELGKLHDLTCPAYHPDEVAKFHPFAELTDLIDEGAWARKALDAACGPIENALKMHELHQAAMALKGADPADVNDWRLELHKAFRDANPGPGTYPSPGSISPKTYNRPLITDGHAATSAAHDGPNTSPVVAAMAPNATSFDRPPLSAGHQSPSPSFMKGGFEYPSEHGVPTRITYGVIERDKARRALSMMHDHLNHMFPSMCPMLDQDAYRQPESRPVPVPAGIGKGGGGGLKPYDLSGMPAVKPVPFDAKLPHVAKAAAPVAAFKAEPDEDGGYFEDAQVQKAFKKRMRKLGKKVISGKLTRDQALSELGRRFSQKGSDEEEGAVQKDVTYVTAGDPNATPFQIRELQDSLNKMAGDPEYQNRVIVLPHGSRVEKADGIVPREIAVTAPPVAAIQPVHLDTDPEVIKAAVAVATSELKDLLVKQQQDFTEKLAEQQRVIDAIADQPDPSTAAFSGLAFSPVRKAARPAGVTEIAEAAARAQRATERELQNLYSSSSDPFAREGYYAALDKMRRGATP